MFDKEEYYRYSKLLEIISIVKLSIIVLGTSLIAYYFGEFIIENYIIRTIIGMTIGIFLSYMYYIKEQIKVEEMRINIENNDELKKIRKKIDQN